MSTNLINNPLRRTNRKSKKAREAFISELLGSTVAAQIFTMRTVNKWTQQELAEAIGTVQTRLPVLEDPSYKNYSCQTLLKIAAAFDVGLIVRFAPFKEIEDWTMASMARDLSPPNFMKEEALLAASGDREAIVLPESQITANPIGFALADLKPGNIMATNTISGPITRPGIQHINFKFDQPQMEGK